MRTGTLIGIWSACPAPGGFWQGGSVTLTPLGEAPKLAGDALAKKLGTVCNQLFALP